MTPITFESLKAAGFDRWNDLFTYWSFPEPLYGCFRIDYLPKDGWHIIAANASDELSVRNVESMEQVANFYKGICDKDMDFLKK